MWSSYIPVSYTHLDVYKRQHVYRPGLRAVRELGVKSPLAEAGLTKKEVRSLAEKLGISVANRPAAPCLATRLPYGADLQPDILRKIEDGETYLKQAGFPVVRLRLHGNIARIEIPVSDFSAFIEKRQEITDRLKQTGFSYITLDMEGSVSYTHLGTDHKNQIIKALEDEGYRPKQITANL